MEKPLHATETRLQGTTCASANLSHAREYKIVARTYFHMYGFARAVRFDTGKR